MVMKTKDQYIPDSEVLVLRTSLIKAFMKCPAACYFRYFKGLVVPQRSGNFMGSCLHKTAEYANKYKRDKKSDVKLSVLKDIFVEEFRSKQNQVRFLKKEKPEKLEKEGVDKLVPVYYSEIALKVHPKYVEESFSFHVTEENLIVTGTIDLAEEDDMIRDLKVVSRVPSWATAMKSFQGKSYRLGYKSKFKTEPVGFMLDFVIRKKDPIVSSSKPIKPMDKDDLEFRAIVIRIAKCIRQGLFYPHREGNPFCSPNACSYWVVCSVGEWRKLTPFVQVYGMNEGSVEEVG